MSKYARLKFGVDNNFNSGQQSRYVLSDWSSEEVIKLHEFIDLSVEAISNFCILGLDDTMSKYN